MDSGRLLSDVPYLGAAEVVQRGSDTLTCLVDRGGPVRVSFFGRLSLHRVADPEALAAPAIRIASLLDLGVCAVERRGLLQGWLGARRSRQATVGGLAATKAEVVQTRAAAKDYLDVDALIQRAGIPLPDALGAAAAVFGRAFNPVLTGKALSFFGDGDLATLPRDVRRRLLDAASARRHPRRVRCAVLGVLACRAGRSSGAAAADQALAGWPLLSSPSNGRSCVRAIPERGRPSERPHRP